MKHGYSRPHEQWNPPVRKYSIVLYATWQCLQGALSLFTHSLTCSFLIPWKYYFVLVLIGLLSCSTAKGAVELTGCDCGPKREEMQSVNVSYCPELNYTVILECRVNGAFSLLWNISELNINHTFSHITSDDAEQIGIFTFSLSRAEEWSETLNSYTSQLLVHSSDLRDLNRSSLSVICQASVNTKKMLLVQVTGMIATILL